MAETEHEPKVYLTAEQWDWLRLQEIKRTTASNQALRESIKLSAKQVDSICEERAQYLSRLRDTFAGQALAGMLASEEENGSAYMPDVAADRAYRMADAMILARSPSSAKGE